VASSWLFILLHKSFIVILSGLPSLHRQKKTIIWFFPCPLPNGNQHSGHYWRARQDAEMNGCGVEASWNVMAHAQKPDFVFRRNGRVHLNRRGRQFSRLLAAEVCASAVVMLDTPCSEIVWRVLATHSVRQFPPHFLSRASTCAITFQLESTWGRLLHPHFHGGTAEKGKKIQGGNSWDWPKKGTPWTGRTCFSQHEAERPSFLCDDD